MTTQAAIMALLDGLTRERGRAVLLISHNLRLVNGFCDEVVVLRAGRAVDRFRPGDDGERHPYTQALHDAEPRHGDRRHRLPTAAQDWGAAAAGVSRDA
ncbi:putative enzyme [uncultured Pleomorphomonas sp.]|uniref:Putative enzyme n=2 Tax=uncultured Pleomorphomonas sp. TaxID=442121 RepID=A0A212LFR3_9HYPH|nr:putative enzyme [uncultured Pleomorphomonas sp.]